MQPKNLGDHFPNGILDIDFMTVPDNRQPTTDKKNLLPKQKAKMNINEIKEKRTKRPDLKSVNGQPSTDNYKPKLKTPISYYGGKQNMLNKILPLIPEHKIYIEPYFGGGALFRAKEPAPSEIINDVNMNVVNFYEVLKTQYEALYEKIESTLHSRETYKKALFIYETPRLFAENPVIRAWAFYVSCNQGFCSKVGSWGYDKGQRCASVFQNKIENFKEKMTQRLRYTQIEQNHAHRVIQSRDREDAFIYADPPYIDTNQGHYGGYREDDFIRDLTVLSQVKGKFLLSNYPSKVLDIFIKEYGWYVKTFNQPLSASHKNQSGTSKRKTEVLVANYPI